MRKLKEAMFNTEPVLTVDQATIEDLKTRARTAPRGRFRLCLHHSPEDRVQEMIIAKSDTSYSRPHCHPEGSASVHLLEGELTVVLFDGQGNVTQKIEMGSRASGKIFCVWLAPGCWHMDLARSEMTVIWETMPGPFVTERSNLFAPWSPDESSPDAVAAFLAGLRI